MKQTPTTPIKIPGQIKLPKWKDPFLLYIADLPGQGPAPLAKLGYVKLEDSLLSRIGSLKSAGMLYFPVPIAAFLVEPVPRRAPQHTEICVQCHLKHRGIPKSGEIFVSPNACCLELIGEVERGLHRLGRTFRIVDIQKLKTYFIDQNRDIQNDLAKQVQGALRGAPPCPYVSFRKQFETNSHASMMLRGWSDVHPQESTTLGFLLYDLFAGTGCSSVAWDLDASCRVFVNPPLTIAECVFEARAEQQLNLHSMGRTVVNVRPEDVPSLRPFTIRVINADCCGLSIPGPFLGTDSSTKSVLRFSPEYLACLGDSAVIPTTGSHFFSVETRAPLPPEAFALAICHPELLPMVRFLIGVMEALRRDVRLQDYRLPPEASALLVDLPLASKLLAQAGIAIPDRLVRWIMHSWVSQCEAVHA